MWHTATTGYTPLTPSGTGHRSIPQAAVLSSRFRSAARFQLQQEKACFMSAPPRTCLFGSLIQTDHRQVFLVRAPTNSNAPPTSLSILKPKTSMSLTSLTTASKFIQQLEIFFLQLTMPRTFPWTWPSWTMNFLSWTSR